MAQLQYNREGALYFPDGFGDPWGVTMSSDGTIFVVDNEKGQVNMFSANRKYIRTIGSLGEAPGELRNPAGVSSSDEGLLFVANNFNHCLEVFNENNGTFVKRIGQGELKNPWDVVTLGGSKIYVADTFNERIAVFSQDGEFSGSFGSRGRGAGQFACPAGLAISPDGYLYVTNRDSQSLHVFTANGRFVKSIVSEALRNPIGIDITEHGQILVANCVDGSVAVFDKDGKHLYSFHADNAHGVAVSPTGYLLVTERSAKQVAVFS